MLFTRDSLLLQHLTVAKAYSLRVNAFNVAYINKLIYNQTIDEEVAIEVGYE